MAEIITLYTDLVALPTEEEVSTDIFAVLTAAGFPVTTWQSGSIGRGLVEVQKKVLYSVIRSAADIGASGFLSMAYGDWLTILAQDHFDEERKPATATVGSIVMRNESGSVYTKAAGVIVLTAQQGAMAYRNTSAVSIANGASASVQFQAETSGAAYNLTGSSLFLSTPTSGVALQTDSTQNWITTAGSDTEDDEQLRARCRSKWGSLVSTGSADAYRYAALSATSEINRVMSVQASGAWTPGDTMVTVIVASPAGGATPAGLALVDAAVQKIRPLGVKVETVSATPVGVKFYGQVTCESAGSANYSPEAISSRLSTLLSTWPIGTSLSDSHVLSTIVGDGVGLVDADISVLGLTAMRKLTSGSQIGVLSSTSVFALVCDISTVTL